MKMTLKIACSTTVAMAALAGAAHGEALADLKAAINGLSAKGAASQVSMQLPKGFSILPVSDVAAATTPVVEPPFVDIQTHGYLKTGYYYSQNSMMKTVSNGGAFGTLTGDYNGFRTEAGVSVKGSVQSPLGEVGTNIAFRWQFNDATDNGTNFNLDRDAISGFWQFEPTMKLEVGRGGGGGLENGIEKNTRRLFTLIQRRVMEERAGQGFYRTNTETNYAGLSYQSGPLMLSGRIMDASRGAGAGGVNSDTDAIGGAFRGVYSADPISLEIAGGYWDQGNAKNLPLFAAGANPSGANFQSGVKYLIGVGAEIDAIPGLAFSVATQTGQLWNGTNTLNASASASISLSDQFSLNLGGGWKRISDAPAGMAVTSQNYGNHEEWGVNGGIYYLPMKELTLGIEADWYQDSRLHNGTVFPVGSQFSDGFSGGFAARYAF